MLVGVQDVWAAPSEKRFQGWRHDRGGTSVVALETVLCPFCVQWDIVLSTDFEITYSLRQTFVYVTWGIASAACALRLSSLWLFSAIPCC